MHSLTPVLGRNAVNIGRFAGSPFGGSGASAAVENTIAMAAAIDAMPTVFAFTVTNTNTALLLETNESLLLETGDRWLLESGAAAKITAFAEMTTPVGTDLVLMVDDPGGTPASQKMTFTNFLTYLVA